MKEEKDEKVRVRKAKSEKGTRSQSMYSFRLDNDNMEWLHQQHNMGRYLNELIRTDRQKKLGLPSEQP